MIKRSFGLVLAFAVFLAGCQTMAPPPPPPLPFIRPNPVARAVPLDDVNYIRVPV